MNNISDTFATARLAAGALFIKDSCVLLVRKTYGNRWDIPGGYVDHGESPSDACQREIFEELGLVRVPERLLVHDWAPSEQEGDKLLYVFYCGTLGDDARNIKLDESELDHWEWVPVDRINDYAIPRLARRLMCAYTAYHNGSTLYLEHGVHILAATPFNGDRARN